MDHLGSSQVPNVSVIIHGKATEILWFRTYVAGSIPVATRFFYFYKSGNNVLDFE